MALQSTTALATVTLQASTSTVTFSGIPNTYRDLILVFTGGITTGIQNLVLALNGDTTNANYSPIHMSGTGSATDGGAINPSLNRIVNYYGYLEADLHTIITINFIDYSNTNKHKTYLSRANNADNGVAALTGRWANTAAINSIQLSPEALFAAGSTFSLYGRIA